MNRSKDVEIVRDQAISWIMHQYDSAFSETDASALKEWLNTDELHQRVYREFCVVWAITGLIPSMKK